LRQKLVLLGNFHERGPSSQPSSANVSPVKKPNQPPAKPKLPSKKDKNPENVIASLSSIDPALKFKWQMEGALDADGKPTGESDALRESLIEVERQIMYNEFIKD
jgi:hypothetical protein